MTSRRHGSSPRGTRGGSSPRDARWLLVALAGALVLLTGCRLDVEVAMTMEPDGSGQLAVTATVDADVVEQATGLRTALELPDARTAGWTVDGPTDTDDGGVTVTLRRGFATAEEATNLLRSLGPPFGADITVARTASDEEVVVTVSGTMGLPGDSFDGFADAALQEAVGGVPFAAQLAAAEATPSRSMSVELHIDLPGSVTETTGSRRDGGVSWQVALDGSSTDLATTAELRAGGVGSSWGGPVATAALVLLFVWIVGGAVLAFLVVRARQRRSRRRIY